MGRAPCCEKMGLKKGPWTPEEDQILTNYIRLYGHSNWRALPKQAGLLRCGKSCRLRWINYLRPDIKRGNFTREEEETIIKLHEILGNRWSAIAAKLPGRTDNEIKNVWHTHLKKRLKQINRNVDNTKDMNPSSFNINEIAPNKYNNHEEPKKENEVVAAAAERPISPQQCSSYTDTSTTVTALENNYNHNNSGNANKDFKVSEDFSVLMDENFWSDMISIDNSFLPLIDNNNIDDGDNKNKKIEILVAPLGIGPNGNYSKLYNQDMEFWCDLLTRPGELSDMPEF